MSLIHLLPKEVEWVTAVLPYPPDCNPFRSCHPDRPDDLEHCEGQVRYRRFCDVQATSADSRTPDVLSSCDFLGVGGSEGMAVEIELAAIPKDMTLQEVIDHFRELYWAPLLPTAHMEEVVYVGPGSERMTTHIYSEKPFDG